MSSRDDNYNRGEKDRRRDRNYHGFERPVRGKSRKGRTPDWQEPGFHERANLEAEKNYQAFRRKRRAGRVIFWIIFTEVVLLCAALAVFLIPKDDPAVDELLTRQAKIDYETETELNLDLGLAVPKPSISVQLLTINEWSRPGIKTDGIQKIVVHYLGNPKTTAQENHDYFESLKDLQDTCMSANYVVGLNGEIIQCVPDGEVAWASNKANYYSISIENCHEDTTGRFNDSTYWSDVHLVAYLTEKYGLGRDDIIRHYDVTGKDCPKWFVEHPEDWEKFRDDVMTYREECEQAQQEKISELLAQTESDALKQYLESVRAGEGTEIEAETTDSSLWDALKKRAEAMQD